MWLPGAGVGGEELTAKYAKDAEKRGLTTKGTRPVELQPGIPRGKYTKGSDIIL